MRRRPLLAALGTGLATGLAGCFSNDGSGSPDSPSDTPTDDATPTPTDSEAPGDDTPDDGETPTGPVRWTIGVEGTPADPVHTAAGLRHVDGDGPARDRWLFVPTESGTLYALDPATGEERWTADLGKRVRDVVVAAGAGLVLAHAGDNTLGDDHLVRAFDADGTARWTFPGSAGANPWGPLELLAADGERVFVASRDDQPMSSGETVWSLDATDGTAAWTGEVGDPYSAAVSEDAVFVASRRAVDAFARPNGERLWRFFEDGVEYQFDTLRADGRTALFATTTGMDTGRMRAIGPDGSHAWQRDRFTTSVTLADALYLGGGPVTAVDPTTGDERWETQGESFLAGGPVADGRLFAGGGGIAAYDTAGGERLWTWTADADIVTAQAATGTAVYAGTGGGNDAPNVVYGRNASDGSERWTFETDSGLSELALGEYVYVGAADGTVYALRR
ncbi:PQQ-binding-like beta-propeller repeat protein [Haloglomus litoreum]|uniref:outer membrane protein assembly factor BamB family protein n=1 Tax=Haloglomus litoreum TaxID=3034026 RepID=UPI0023E8B7B7|nr:PQQ-binding-like beta-propeller repeat protein [Haloglomus sp. DT116]